MSTNRLYEADYWKRREENNERELEKATVAPPKKVIPTEKVNALVNRLSQVPKRLPNIVTPRPANETVDIGPEGGRSIPTYEAAKDEHLALFWARQQVLLMEAKQRREAYAEQKRRAAHPEEQGRSHSATGRSASSSLSPRGHGDGGAPSSAPTSARPRGKPLPLQVGAALLELASFRKPRPPPKKGSAYYLECAYGNTNTNKKGRRRPLHSNNSNSNHTAAAPISNEKKVHVLPREMKWRRTMRGRQRRYIALAHHSTVNLSYLEKPVHCCTLHNAELSTQQVTNGRGF